jgi:hypothetical protein
MPGSVIVQLLIGHRGAVQRHVVVDELTEVGVAGQDGGIVQRRCAWVGHLDRQGVQTVRRCGELKVDTLGS